MRAILFLLLNLAGFSACCQETYAEKLGWNSSDKVVILHVDDAGMSYDSNEGAIQALTKGIATSVSVMMPCPWVPGFISFLKDHPEVDAGLHLTMTSEWKDYRWGPLSGKPQVPGMTDSTGSLWSSVEQVVQHASADEIEKEIHAQLDRARGMGFQPTHLDSHMGTLFATPQFLERYIKVGIQEKIPVMLPGGHATLIARQMNMPEEQLQQIRQLGQMIWASGLPVLDDLHNESYNWQPPSQKSGEKEFNRQAAAKYIEALKNLKPGLTMVIMHCTN
jgi:predicted glycoside hydrolase/deacetylase ChbG (UPF0249 family)